MKTLFSTLLIAVVLFSSTLQAQQKEKHQRHNYVVLTKKIPQLEPIILTAEALKAEDGEDFGDFQVVICGKNIDNITNPEKINSFIHKAEKAGVQLVACGFSLDKFKVSKSEVPKEMKIVNNGIFYNFHLLKKGYKSLSL